MQHHDFSALIRYFPLIVQNGRPKKFSGTQIEHALELLRTHSYKHVAAITGICGVTLGRAKATLKT